MLFGLMTEVISVADFYVAFYRIKILLHDLLCFYNHFYKDKVKFCYRYSEFMYIYTCVFRLIFSFFFLNKTMSGSGCVSGVGFFYFLFSSLWCY